MIAFLLRMIAILGLLVVAMFLSIVVVALAIGLRKMVQK